MITFATQEDFEKAVMAVLEDKLCMQVVVRNVSDGDYYNPGKVTQVSVTLQDEDGNIVCSDTDSPY